MRIVCPKCVAQYEVDDSAIPENGREVQCANCEHIWFQDYIEMLPDRPKEAPDDAKEIFDDLDGVTETPFHSARAEPTFGDDDDDGGNLLADGLDADDPDEDAPADVDLPPVADDVKEVLQSEAAFSSARAQLDAAAAASLDGRDMAAALEDAEPADDAPATAAEPAPAAEADDDDELAAFLDAHAEEPEDAGPEDAGPQTEPDVDDAADPAPEDPAEDPLADLDAIRSQLAAIQDEDPADDDDDGGDKAVDAAPEYTPVLPDDDPEPEDDEDDLDRAISSFADLDGAGPEDDDFDDEDEDARPRRAYRADGLTGTDDDPEDADADEDEDDPEDRVGEDVPEDTEAADAIAAAAAPAAATLGMTRPRAKGVRARAMPGFGSTPETSDDAPRDAEPVEAEDVAEPVRPARPDRDGTSPRTERPAPGDRKALLPDVDELNDSLRDPSAQPSRRDGDLIEAGDTARRGGGFRRGFVWALFVIALLLAAYVMRPQIIAAIPAAAAVLDPYAGIVDSIRLTIDGMIGG